MKNIDKQTKIRGGISIIPGISSNFNYVGAYGLSTSNLIRKMDKRILALSAFNDNFTKKKQIFESRANDIVFKLVHFHYIMVC